MCRAFIFGAPVSDNQAMADRLRASHDPVAFAEARAGAAGAWSSIRLSRRAGPADKMAAFDEPVPSPKRVPRRFR